MLLCDMREIGNKLLAIRKRMGMTQVEVAEAAADTVLKQPQYSSSLTLWVQDWM